MAVRVGLRARASVCPWYSLRFGVEVKVSVGYSKIAIMAQKISNRPVSVEKLWV